MRGAGKGRREEVLTGGAGLSAEAAGAGRWAGVRERGAERQHEAGRLRDAGERCGLSALRDAGRSGAGRGARVEGVGRAG